MASNFTLPPSALDAVFPFHLVVDDQLRILQAGPALTRLVPDLEGLPLPEAFHLLRPQGPHDFESLAAQDRTVFLMQAKAQPMLLLRAQGLLLTEDRLAFLGGPRIGGPADMEGLGMSLADLPPHDPLGDYLLLYQNQAASLAECQHLARNLQDLNGGLELGLQSRTSELTAARDGLRQAHEQLQLERREHAHAQWELDEVRALLDTALDLACGGLLVVDPPDRITRFNRTFLDLFRVPDSVMAPGSLRLLLAYVGEQLEDAAAFARILEDSPEAAHRTRLPFKDGRIFEVATEPLRSDGRITGRVLAFRDLTRSVHLEGALHESESRHRLLFEATPQAILLEEDGLVSYANPAAAGLLGAGEPEALRGRTLLSLVAPERREAITEAFAAQEKGAPPRTLEAPVLRLDGKALESALTRVAFFHQERPFAATVIHDLSDLKRMEDLLTYQEAHDALTGLANRTLFMSHLRHSIALAKRQKQRLLVALLDLDRFRWVNDSLGHGAGDELLRTLAGRMKGQLRESDLVARIGADEFALIIYNPGESQGAHRTLQRLVDAVAQPLDLQEREVSVTTSAGCSSYPEDGQDAESLLLAASVAMAQGKKDGHAGVQIFDPALRTRIEERSQLERDLRQAIPRGELRLLYQPQVDLLTGSILGAEALVRWTHPERGPVPPARFIPLAEETGFITALGEWIFRQACEQARRWEAEGITGVRISVNLSGRQLLRPDIGAILSECLAQTGVNPSCLDLELTESVSMDDPARLMPLLHELKDLGLGLAIDDFGTGYSNMRYLRQFPVDKLKLDGSFVRGLAGNPGSLAICDAVISLAHKLGLKVVAEMAETEGEVCLLGALGCDQVQGHFFAPPLPANTLAALLREGPMRVPRTGSTQDRDMAILILDDDPKVTASLRRTLASEEVYDLFIAHQPEDAFETLARQRIGVVLCDYHMAGMDGVEFLSRARRIYPAVHRVLFSGDRDFEMATAAINRGAVHHILAKPFTDVDLKTLMRRIFRVQEHPQAMEGEGEE